MSYEFIGKFMLTGGIFALTTMLIAIVIMVLGSFYVKRYPGEKEQLSWIALPGIPLISISIGLIVAVVAWFYI